tara:strand:- start:6285 stop:6416 length:132 start_codon:yes stop_codon:yes gene_type:complete
MILLLPRPYAALLIPDTLKVRIQKASESHLYCNAALRKSPVTL